MKIGDVYLVEIPTIDGHEQAGLRPALIVNSAIGREGERIANCFNSPLDFKNKSKYLPFYFSDRTG